MSFQIIAKSKGLQWKEIKRLGQLQETLGVSLTDMDNLVQEVLHKQPYKKQEICDVLGVTAEELAETSLSPNTLTGDKIEIQYVLETSSTYLTYAVIFLISR